MRRFRTLAIVAMCATVALPAQAAQGDSRQASLPRQLVAPGQQQASGSSTALAGADARVVDRELQDVMNRYPPSVEQILRLDPSLMLSPTYLAPYPALQAFLAVHPEVVKNPSYYFGNAPGYYPQESPTQRIVHDVLDGIAMLTIFGTIVAVVTWLIRIIVDYRRWNRLAKVQADAHTKLLDRFTSNDELIAYVQSPAGSRFLQSAPIALDPGTRRLGAPVSRILWSSQAGLVIAMAGFAFQYVSGRVDADAQQALYAIGTVALFVGIGFLLSAVASYVLSHRLHLFEPTAGSAAPAPVAPMAGPHGPEA